MVFILLLLTAMWKEFGINLLETFFLDNTFGTFLQKQGGVRENVKTKFSIWNSFCGVHITQESGNKVNVNGLYVHTFKNKILKNVASYKIAINFLNNCICIVSKWINIWHWS